MDSIGMRPGEGGALPDSQSGKREPKTDQAPKEI